MAEPAAATSRRQGEWIQPAGEELQRALQSLTQRQQPGEEGEGDPTALSGDVLRVCLETLTRQELTINVYQNRLSAFERRCLNNREEITRLTERVYSLERANKDIRSLAILMCIIGAFVFLRTFCIYNFFRPRFS